MYSKIFRYKRKYNNEVEYDFYYALISNEDYHKRYDFGEIIYTDIDNGAGTLEFYKPGYFDKEYSTPLSKEETNDLNKLLSKLMVFR